MKIVSFAVLLLALTAFSPPVPAVDTDVPRAAGFYKRTLAREARRVWGLDAPVAVFAGQVHQESGWRPEAVSRVGARGLAQFMPATARWWCEATGTAPEDCLPHNPAWALRALVGYNRWLYERVDGAADDCERMQFALRAYNGGETRLSRERAQCAAAPGCDPSRNAGHTERHNAGRSAGNWRENTEYPRRILQRHAPRYEAAGWGPGACP